MVFRKGLTLPIVHCKKHRAQPVVSGVDIIPATPIYKGKKKKPKHMFATVVSVATSGPPLVEIMTAVMFSVWLSFSKFIGGGGWIVFASRRPATA